jgi:hypothetical protein
MRNYFYFVNTRGKLFLEETKIKNFATCFKDIPFLNRFFKNLQPNETNSHPEYKFIYICMKEFNFLKCEDTPIVFFDLMDGNLIYGGNLKTKFQPNSLIFDIDNFRLYQQIDFKFGSFGLLSENVMMTLNIQREDSGEYFLYYNNEIFKLLTKTKQIKV